MRELSVGAQRYRAVMAVLSGGRTVTTNGPRCSSASVVTDDAQDEEMAVRRERAVAHNPGKDLEGQGFTPLANIGSGFGDLSDKAEDGGPNLTEPKRLIARPHLDGEGTILVDLARLKREREIAGVA